ncbi:hypothetical protein CALVIDRAFT_529053 [Calocera viscosa TUFC12733]|uniref:BTB domain-containing protein n=1 Tax=Calocera viscosa (strain TUFC12733) TaxID=1330018 RepID=A0A167JWD5_CALVF|nr:hypothetical protein CALVIDRAFT_529053 [Calocera viscosa TUFC12733]
MTLDSATKPFQVPAMFRDDPEADFAISSSDDVQFRVLKYILARGSVHFGGIFGDPKSAHFPVDDTLIWPEPAVVICRLLEYMYPVENPKVSDLAEVFTLLRAANKWKIRAALSALKENLLLPKFVNDPDNAVKIYGLFCEMDMKNEKEVVEEYASRHPDPCNPSLDDSRAGMSALDLLRLIRRRTHPNEAFDRTFVSLDTTEELPFRVHSKVKWIEELLRMTDGDLLVTSSDGAQFRIYKRFVLQGSSTLTELIDAKASFSSTTATSTAKSTSNATPSQKPSSPPNYATPLRITWAEPAWIVRTLLWYLHPVAKPDLADYSLEEIMILLDVATTANIVAAITPLKDELMMYDRIVLHPLQVYGFLCHMGFEEQKKIAIRYAIRFDPLKHNIQEDFLHLAANELADLVCLRRTRIKETVEAIKDFPMPAVGSYSVCPRHTPVDKVKRKTMGDILKEALTRNLEQDLSIDQFTSLAMLAQLGAVGAGACAECEGEKYTSMFEDYGRALGDLKDKLEGIMTKRAL